MTVKDAMPVRTENLLRLYRAGKRDFKGANLAFADLQGARLSGSNFYDANLEGANLRQAELRGAKLWAANLAGADLADADLRDADLGGANLQNASLRGARLQNTNLTDANLGGAVLSDAHFDGSTLVDANLAGANLTGAHLVSADLMEANLAAASLQSADLQGANLGYAYMVGTRLEGALLAGANLAGANYDAETTFPAGLNPVAHDMSQTGHDMVRDLFRESLRPRKVERTSELPQFDQISIGVKAEGSDLTGPLLTWSGLVRTVQDVSSTYAFLKWSRSDNRRAQLLATAFEEANHLRRPRKQRELFDFLLGSHQQNMELGIPEGDEMALRYLADLLWTAVPFPTEPRIHHVDFGTRLAAAIKAEPNWSELRDAGIVSAIGDMVRFHARLSGSSDAATAQPSLIHVVPGLVSSYLLPCVHIEKGVAQPLELVAQVSIPRNFVPGLIWWRAASRHQEQVDVTRQEQTQVNEPKLKQVRNDLQLYEQLLTKLRGTEEAWVLQAICQLGQAPPLAIPAGGASCIFFKPENTFGR